jgi:hypothetical protein
MLEVLYLCLTCAGVRVVSCLVLFFRCTLLATGEAEFVLISHTHFPVHLYGIHRLQRVRQLPLYRPLDGASDFHVVVGHGASLLSQGD